MSGFNDERHDHGAGGSGGTTIKPRTVATPSTDPDLLAFEEGGTFKAVDGDQLIDSGRDMAPVVQSMFDTIDPAADGQYRQVRIKAPNGAEWTQAVTPPNDGRLKIDLTGKFDVVADVDFLNDGSNQLREVHIDGRGARIGGSGAASPGYGFDLQNTIRCSVVGPKINSMGSGIALGQESVARDCEIGSLSFDGVDVLGSDSWVVDCDIGNCRQGIDDSRGNTHIRGNNVFLCDLAGIIKTSGKGGTIVDNRVNDTNEEGLQVTGGIADMAIRGNRAINNGQNTSANNGKRVGIKLDVTDSVIESNLATDQQTTATQYYGISILSGCDRNVWGLNNSNENAGADVNGSIGAASKANTNIPTL